MVLFTNKHVKKFHTWIKLLFIVHSLSCLQHFLQKHTCISFSLPCVYMAIVLLKHRISHTNIAKAISSLHHFVVLHFIVSCRKCIFFLANWLWQPYVEQVCWYHFPNSICSLIISLSHFGNSHISNFFTIMFVLWSMNCNNYNSWKG